MTATPEEQIRESHKLTADGEVMLFELTPADGSGTLYFKNDNPVTWQGHTYEGFPVNLSGEKQTSDTGLSMPRIDIGQPNIDMTPFKPLVFDGALDNATVVRKLVLLDHLLNDVNVAKVQIYRVKRVEGYSRTSVSMQLATLSDSLGFSIPHKQYLPPDFPSVQM